MENISEYAGCRHKTKIKTGYRKLLKNWCFRSISCSIIFLLSTCYGVNNNEYLNISFEDNKLNGNFFIKYIDSVRNKDLIVPQQVKDIFLNGDSLTNQERFVYFDDEPKEWYVINFIMFPCWIESIYNPQLSPSMINKRSSLGDQEIKRIETRFIKQVLRPAELYGKKCHLPDSIIYDLRKKIN